MNRYEKAWRYLLNKLPNWKRLAIQEDIAAGKDSSFVSIFTQEVIKLAESTGSIPVSAKTEPKEELAAVAKDEIPPWHATNGANGDDYEN